MKVLKKYLLIFLLLYIVCGVSKVYAAKVFECSYISTEDTEFQYKLKQDKNNKKTLYKTTLFTSEEVSYSQFVDVGPLTSELENCPEYLYKENSTGKMMATNGSTDIFGTGVATTKYSKFVTKKEKQCIYGSINNGIIASTSNPTPTLEMKFPHPYCVNTADSFLSYTYEEKECPQYVCYYDYIAADDICTAAGLHVGVFGANKLYFGNGAEEDVKQSLLKSLNESNFNATTGRNVSTTKDLKCISYNKTRSELSNNNPGSDDFPGLPDETITECKDIFTEDVMYVINAIFNSIKIIVPILILVFGILDFVKAIFAIEDKEMKKAQSNFIKRLILGLVFFFIPTLVQFVVNIINNSIDCTIK